MLDAVSKAEKSVEWVTMSVDGWVRSFDSERWIYVDGCSIASFLLVLRETFDDGNEMERCAKTFLILYLLLARSITR